MTSRNSLLPSRDQCYNLTDDQCHKILELRDPRGIRANKDWEALYQPELIRHYMYMRSFPQIEQLMKSKLDWSYKTYNHRFRDWLFPVDRIERQQVVIDLYNEVSDSDANALAETPPATLPRLAALRPALQPTSPQPQQPTSVPADFFFQPNPQRTTNGSHTPGPHTPAHTPERMSLTPIETCLPRSSHGSHTPDRMSTTPIDIYPSRSSCGSHTPDRMSTTPIDIYPPRSSSGSHTPDRMSTTPVDIYPPRSSSGAHTPDRMSITPVDVFPQRTSSGSHTPDRMSIATVETWTTGSSQSAYTHNDDTFSVSGFSIMTSASSISDAGKHQISPSDYESEQPPRPLRLPKHDPKAGLWNDTLRVVPCGIDHTGLQWHETFPSCEGCGYSQWHALMIYARHMDINSFIGAMNQLPGFDKMDFAGNYPIHYLMCAGVNMEHFSHFSQYAASTCRQNVFGQNPIHVLNPQDLGDQLITLLEWFRHSRQPPGLLLTQRDINCRTPLHALLQRPLERSLYRQILKIFPFAEHQLRSLDTSGNNTVKMMSKASNRIKLESATSFSAIQAGITEIRLFLDEADQSQQTGRVSNYGFHDIARGARGTSYYGFFECRICLQTNAHSNSYLDQIRCACRNNRDRNAPDETGMTPAHLIVMRDRCSSGDDPGKEEPASETAALFRTLIPNNDPTLREALHALDKEGNSLVFNIATRGFDEILAYVLEMEEEGRRGAMVNSFGRRPDGGEWSVLSAVYARLRRAIDDYKMAHPLRDAGERYRHYEMYTRLVKCKDLLKSYGAKENPAKVERWKVWS